MLMGGSGSSMRAPFNLTDPCSIRRDSSARTSVPTRRSASRTRTGLPMATSPSRISTRGNALALISPIVTGCPMAFASCAASAERTASPVKTALAQRNPPPITVRATTSRLTTIFFDLLLRVFRATISFIPQARALMRSGHRLTTIFFDLLLRVFRATICLSRRPAR